MNEAIYPDVKISETHNGITISTTVRKQHQGKWYKWRHLQMAYSTDDLYKRKMLARLHEAVYQTIILGKIDPSLMAYDNEPIFIEDTDQRSEEERLYEKYTFKGFSGFGK